VLQNAHSPTGPQPEVGKYRPHIQLEAVWMHGQTSTVLPVQRELSKGPTINIQTIIILSVFLLLSSSSLLLSLSSLLSSSFDVMRHLSSHVLYDAKYK